MFLEELGRGLGVTDFPRSRLQTCWVPACPCRDGCSRTCSPGAEMMGSFQPCCIPGKLQGGTKIWDVEQTWFAKPFLGVCWDLCACLELLGGTFYTNWGVVGKIPRSRSLSILPQSTDCLSPNVQVSVPVSLSLSLSPFLSFSIFLPSPHSPQSF